MLPNIVILIFTAFMDFKKEFYLHTSTCHHQWNTQCCLPKQIQVKLKWMTTSVSMCLEEEYRRDIFVLH